MDQPGKSPITTFIPAYPQGYYTLQLEDRAQRAIAIMLCQADQASTEDLMRGISVNGRPAGGPVKCLKWPDRQVLHPSQAWSWLSDRVIVICSAEQSSPATAEHERFL